MKTITLKKLIFKLVSVDKPLIENGKLVKENEIGGIKYIYKISTHNVKILNILNKKFRFWQRKESETQKIFYRPLKVYWGKDRNKLPYNYWGKKDHPLTNLVILLKKDFTSIKDVVGVISIENAYIDTKLASLIRKEIPRFEMEYKSNLF